MREKNVKCAWSKLSMLENTKLARYIRLVSRLVTCE